MNKPKITIGKIQLNVKKADEPIETKKDDDLETTTGFVYYSIFNSFDFVLEMTNKSKISFSGFGLFGKQETKNSINNAIEELAIDDLESQRVKDIMGISEFGRKAKTFDITVNIETTIISRCFLIYCLYLFDLFTERNC